MKIKPYILLISILVSSDVFADRNIEVMPNLSENPTDKSPKTKHSKNKKIQQIKEQVANKTHKIIMDKTTTNQYKKAEVLAKLKLLKKKIVSKDSQLKAKQKTQKQALAKIKSADKNNTSKTTQAKTQTLKKIVGTTTK